MEGGQHGRSSSQMISHGYVIAHASSGYRGEEDEDEELDTQRRTRSLLELG